MSKKILLLDGNTRSALAVTRSLGAAGHFVEVGESSSSVSLSSSSRYAKGRFQYPDPLIDPTNFKLFILNKLETKKYDFLISTTDHTLNVLYNFEQEIRALTNFPFVNKESFEKVQDKAKLIELAKKQDISTPRTIKILGGKQDIEQQISLLKDCQFPLFIKPRSSSQLDSKNNLVKAPNFLAKDLSELKNFLSKPELEQIKFIAQEFISGVGQGMFCLIQDGVCSAHFSHQRLLEKPPEGGVSVLSKSIPTDEVLIKKVNRLLLDLNWQGVAMIEFKRADDGTPYLMEINPRFWGSLQLAIDSGVNFPGLLIGEQTDGSLDRAYQTDIRLRWELGSLDHFLIQLKRKKSSYLSNFFSQNAMDFFKPKTTLELFRLSDPGPFFKELIQYLNIC